MNRNNYFPRQEIGIFALPSIENFELTVGNGQYWLNVGKRSFPIIMTPCHLKRLFEIEGIPIRDFSGDEPFQFHKATLLRSELSFRGDLFDREGHDITPQPCWVKENDDADIFNQ